MFIKDVCYRDYENCEFCERTAYEYDTGYSEYGCTLGDENPDNNPCAYEYCPLNFTYEVEE